MKTAARLKIEWRRLDKRGSTCSRCAETGNGLRRAVRKLRAELKPSGIRVSLRETKLAGRQIQQSNLVLFNGKPIEQLLPGTTASTNHCDSCARLMNGRVSCRTVRHKGRTLEAIPARLIRRAALRAFGARTR